MKQNFNSYRSHDLFKKTSLTLTETHTVLSISISINFPQKQLQTCQELDFPLTLMFQRRQNQTLSECRMSTASDLDEIEMNFVFYTKWMCCVFNKETGKNQALPWFRQSGCSLHQCMGWQLSDFFSEPWYTSAGTKSVFSNLHTNDQCISR